MIKFFRILLILVLNFFIFFNVASSNDNKIKIGLLVPLSGDNAILGKQILNAIQLANSGIMHMDGDQNALTTEGEDFKKARESFIRKKK